MNVFKKIWNWLKEPRIWWYIVVTVLLVGAVAGTAVLIANPTAAPQALAYVMYGLSAVLLAYFVFATVKIVPRFRSSVRSWAEKREFTNRLLKQYGFRTLVFAVGALIISAGNAVLNLTIGLINLSVWFIALGLYYLLLSAMRGGVLLYHGKKKNYDEAMSEYKAVKTYIICGVFLILLPIALSGAIWEIVGSDRAFVHSGLMIYVAATYTFYKVVMSVYNFAKARKGDEMTVRAIRNINLADSLVSVLALQTAMFHEFSSGESLGLPNAITGAVVCALTAVIGLFMIINGVKTMKQRRITENE